jgi:uncharacterized protein
LSTNVKKCILNPLNQKAYFYQNLFLIEKKFMVRPRRCRRIEHHPNYTYFKPQGIPLVDLEEINLLIDEFEAIRLKDFEGLEQEQAAEKMGISQPTLFRLLNSGHNKIADALIHGKAIKIEGGSICFGEHVDHCKMNKNNCPYRTNKENVDRSNSSYTEESDSK